MRPGRSLALYLLAIFAGGSLLAPWLYQLAHWVADFIPSFQSLADKPFPRYVNRCFLLVAVVGLWPFFKSLGRRTRAELGLGSESNWAVHLSFGFLVGFISLASIALLSLITGAVVWDHGRTELDLARHLLKTTVTATVVSVLEETLFRGALLGALRQAHSWRLALLLSSLMYAMAHFLQKAAVPDRVEWYSGLTVLADMLRGFWQLDLLMPSLLNLTLAGIILGQAYRFFGTLYFPIGLHAGWIFWLKSFHFLTEESSGANSAVWGTSKMIDGWLALAVLTLLAVALNRMYSRLPKLSPLNRGPAALDNRTP